jgi:CheY-like chemotaxis protein
MKTILVAEDEPHIRRLIQVNLERAGYRVETVDNGQQAWERLQQGGVALLLTDGVMPRLNGLDLIQQIQANEQWFNMPIVLIQWPLYNTRPYEEQVAEAQQKLQITAVVPKPFSPAELVRIVGQILKRC